MKATSLWLDAREGLVRRASAWTGDNNPPIRMTRNLLAAFAIAALLCTILFQDLGDVAQRSVASLDQSQMNVASRTSSTNVSAATGQRYPGTRVRGFEGENSSSHQAQNNRLMPAGEEIFMGGSMNKTVKTKKQLLTPLPTITKLRVLAYGLYGNRPRYIKGMLNVAKQTPLVYPQWQLWIYHDNSVNQTVLNDLQEMAHVQLYNVEETSLFPSWVHTSLSPSTWRFLVATNASVDAWEVRDSDSLPSARESAAVQEWLNSDKAFHVLRDHPYHHPHLRCPINAGMWGGRSWAVPQMDQLLRGYFEGSTSQHQYGIDQDFLWNVVLPFVHRDVLQHDSYYCREANAVAFPIAREKSEADGNNPYWYVGNIGAQNNQPKDQYAKHLWGARPTYKRCLEDRRQKEVQLLRQGIPKELFGKYINTTFTGKLEGSFGKKQSRMLEYNI